VHAEFGFVPVPTEVAFLVANTNVAHSLVDSPYAKRRESCDRVAAAMALRWPKRKITHLRDVSDLGDAEAMKMLNALREVRTNEREPHDGDSLVCLPSWLARWPRHARSHARRAAPRVQDGAVSSEDYDRAHHGLLEVCRDDVSHT